jgi:hypothetical protein
MGGESVIGNVAELKAGEVLLPAFVLRKEDGLYVDLPALEMAHVFGQFAERVFASGARFAELDYDLFLHLIFLWEDDDIARLSADLKRKGRPPQVRIARDIVNFPQERRDLYRGLKVDDDLGAAEYLFEQISVEREEADPDAPEGKRVVLERIYLDFDEFVAALWDKGVRFGIDAKRVRDAIKRDQVERVTIAERKAPEPGTDASVDEQSDLLHRDDTPKLLPNGRMDLRHYRNRFPQVSGGTRLFKKVPRQLGRLGWTVEGHEVAPEPAKDFDIETLAGPGTMVTRDSNGEYVIAAQDGFLDIDSASGMLSVVDKIISREGVSMRTTGDLSLQGDDYEEHGEVQEKRVVEGHNMTFCADVFGEIRSSGGVVTFKQNISGGSAQSPKGTVVVEGSASRAFLQALNGEIVVERAEGCAIVASRVRIARAVGCDIVADEATIEQAEGCVITAKSISVQNGGARRGVPTLALVILPDLSSFDSQREALETGRREALAQAEKLTAVIPTLMAQADMKTYAAMAPRIRSKSVTLTAAQQTQWDALIVRVSPLLRKVSAVNEEIKTLKDYAVDVEKELQEVERARKEALAGRVQADGGGIAGDDSACAPRRPLRLRQDTGDPESLWLAYRRDPATGVRSRRQAGGCQFRGAGILALS